MFHRLLIHLISVRGSSSSSDLSVFFNPCERVIKSRVRLNCSTEATYTRVSQRYHERTFRLKYSLTNDAQSSSTS